MSAAATTDGVDFVVKRDDWRQCRFIPAAVESELQPGQVLFRVDRFAFTSNNVSYALAGDMLGYWRFFPAAEGWGRLPVMGFGDVIRSNHPAVPEGERVFGFFPMSTHLVVQADRVSPQQFVDASPHRGEFAPVYRQYARVSADPLYEARHEDRYMLLWGLFLTSFLVDDLIAENGFFGAQSFVLASASSKTAIALAFLLSERSRGRVIGLTSARNLSFVDGLKCYDQAVAYDDLKALPAAAPVVIVDMSGDGEVVSALHHHFADNVRYSCTVGATHWESSRPGSGLPGAPPTFFFAPAQLQKRIQEWGPDELRERLGAAWLRFRESTDEWLHIARGYGQAAVERAYRDTLEGRSKPNEGHVVSLWEREDEATAG